MSLGGSGVGSSGHAADGGGFGIGSFGGLLIQLLLSFCYSVDTLCAHQLLNGPTSCNCLNATLSAGNRGFCFVPPSSCLGLWSLVVLWHFFLGESLVSRLRHSGAIWTPSKAGLLRAESLGLCHGAFNDGSTYLCEVSVQS